MAAARRKEADPPTQLRALARGLQKDGLARGYVLRGEERWFRERAIELVCGAALERGLELARHDAKDPEFQLAALLDDLGGAPMFSAGRCVVVRNADVVSKKVDGKDGPFVRAALAFVAREGPGALVVDGSGLRADQALSKAIVKRGGTLVACRRLYDSPPPWRPAAPHESELAQWLLVRAREKKLPLRPDDAVYLVAATGNDLAALDTELDKLRHGGGRPVRELVGWHGGGTPWDAANELLSGDPARALSALESLFSGGFHGKDGRHELNPVALGAILLSTLRARTREAAAASRAVARGASPGALLGGGPKGARAAEELEARVRQRSAAEWERIWRDVAALDRMTRTGAEVDVNDFARLALRWRRPDREREAAAGRR